MKVPFMHVCEHIIGFITKELVPKYFRVEWQQAAANVLITSRTPHILNKALDRPELQALDIVDREKGEIDIKLLYDMGCAALEKKQSFTFTVPDLFNKGMLHKFELNKADIDAVYQSITGV